MRREMRAHFGEMRLGYLWALIEPALHLAVMSVLFVYILKRHSPLGGDLNLFMLTGLLPYFLFYKLALYLAGSIDENRPLLKLPPVKPFDVILARALLESATYIFVGFLLFAGLALVGESTDVIPYQPLKLMSGIAATVAFGFGIGCINTVIRLFLHNWTTIFGLLLSPAFLLSGIWFLPDAIPQPFRDILLLNPVMHYIMWVRAGFYRGYEPPELDSGYALMWSAGVVVVGLALLRISRRKLLEPT